MSRPLLLNTTERRPLYLIEFLNKTQELQSSSDGMAVASLVEKDIIWLLVMAQILNRASAQYMQEYLDQKKLQDAKANLIIDNLQV